MPRITPSIRKWLAHLDAGNPILWAERGNPYAGAAGGRITAMMVCRLVDLGYIEFKGDRAQLTDRGRIARVAAEVTPGEQRTLRNCDDYTRYPTFNCKLYKLGLIDDTCRATERGRRVLALLEAPSAIDS